MLDRALRAKDTEIAPWILMIYCCVLNKYSLFVKMSTRHLRYSEIKWKWYILSLSLTHFLCHTHTHIRTHTRARTHNTHKRAHAHKHTHSHTHSLTHSHTLMQNTYVLLTMYISQAIVCYCILAVVTAWLGRSFTISVKMELGVIAWDKGQPNCTLGSVFRQIILIRCQDGYCNNDLVSCD